MHSNIFKNLPIDLSTEQFVTLLQRQGIKIERIVSHGQVTPEGEDYDQSWDEWVLLIQGHAILYLETTGAIELKPGDYLLIPAHEKHRVTYTDPDTDTIWLALHFHA